jgi:hypothetical protein
MLGSKPSALPLGDTPSNLLALSHKHSLGVNSFYLNFNSRKFIEYSHNLNEIDLR